VKRPRAVDSSLHPAVIPAAVIASGLIAPLPAWTAPGDLDPGYGDVGRVELDLSRAAWSIEAEEDGYLLTGAQPESCYFYCVEGTDFNTRLLDDGSLDEAYSAAELEDVLGYDSVLQPDGKGVTVGQSGAAGDTDLAVYRLLNDGSLDPGFGVGGITTVTDAVGFALAGRRIILEPDGKITVAGILDINRLVVVRLLPDGALDASFGTGGVFTTDATVTTGIQPGLVQMSGGSYRLTVQVASGEQSICKVLALTATGAIDSTFGVDGLAAVDSGATGSSYCNALARDAADGLYVAGLGPAGGLIVRLLENGDVDPAFAGAAVATLMADATALATDVGGAILVAGHDRTEFARAQIVRLHSNGQLDTAFGSSGIARVELESDWPYATNIQDLKVLADRGLAVTGAHTTGGSGIRPFASRLLGDGAGGGPGVLSIETVEVAAIEGERAVVKVRRIGGSSGSVSVDIETHEVDWSITPATTDQDFVSTSTTLTWPDGDATEREFVIDIPADEGVERIESFAATLLNPQGGAGLGGRTSGIDIRGDGYPAGLFTIDRVDARFGEGSEASQFVVYRSDYDQGTVSVTVRSVGGTASNGSDYEGEPVTLTWNDGDTSERYVGFRVVSDSISESPETLIVELSAADGGAVIGTQSSAEVTLIDVPPRPDRGDDGGGGSFDLLLAAALGLCAALRRRIASGVVHMGRWLDAALLGPQRRTSRRRSAAR
jgi:uncharacterized delta-60 repeat protein